MLSIYTVSFFGHRYIERASEIECRLNNLLHDLIAQKEYVEFLIGRDGEFDLLASAAIKRAVSSYGYGNTHFTLVLPYMKAEYRDNEKNTSATMMKSRYVQSPQKRTRSLLSKFATEILLTDQTLWYAVFSTKAAERTRQYSMPISRASVLSTLQKKKEHNKNAVTIHGSSVCCFYALSFFSNRFLS